MVVMVMVVMVVVMVMVMVVVRASTWASINRHAVVGHPGPEQSSASERPKTRDRLLFTVY